MCTDWYYQYRNCGHASFAHRQKCGYFSRFGYCSYVSNQYLNGGGTCPSCFRLRLAGAFGSSMGWFFR